MSIRAKNEERTKWEIVYYPAGGKGKRKKLTYNGSEANARSLEMELRRNGLPILNTINPKIIDVLPDYLVWHKLHRADETHRDLKRTLNFLIPHFGHLQVPRITQDVIQKYKEKRSHAPRATNKELHYLKGLINYMVKNNLANPLSFKIEKVPYKPKLPQVPHPEDFNKFLNEITDPLKKAMIIFMWENGLRWREVSHLRWENINWRTLEILLADTKGNHPAITGFSGKIQALIEPHKQPRGYIFLNKMTGKPYTTLHRLFRTASKRAGIPKLRPHLLRHAFGTMSLEALGNLRDVQELLRHKDIATTQIYTHIATARRKILLEKVWAHMMPADESQPA